MKLSNTLLFLLPVAVTATPAVDATPSLPNATPPTPLPALQLQGGRLSDQDGRQQALVADVQTPRLDPDTTVATSVPAESSMGSVRLRTRGSRGATKTHQVRSEGSLGQTPWIGMAIGLTCTTLAAVMLG
ncbi:hypothetical protein PHISP_07381 [Aspergillus sp. HF37]|nr:hypothetical protein PHISP_07381 [Aspergillus sp. HF37]